MSDKEQELNEFLATEIMGWYECAYRPKYNNTDGEYLRPASKGFTIGEKRGYHKDGIFIISKEDWNPLTDLEQAFDVLEKYCGKNNLSWDMGNSTMRGNITIVEMNEAKSLYTRSHFESNTKPKAIVGAILKAESKFEEFEGVF